MKKIEHTNAKKRERSLGSKILLYSVLGFFGFIFLISFIMAWGKMSKGSTTKLIIYAIIGVGIWQYLKYKKRSGGVFFVKKETKTNDLSFSLNGSVAIPNPYAGIFISGGAGAGKSKSIIEPLIYDAGKKGFTGVVYDFKFPELASYVNTAYKNTTIKPYFVNFSDLSRSNRINPIAPELMINDSFAREFAFSILANLNPTMISKPDFWSENATALLASVFWYLKKNHPQYCTLPHAMSMILQPNLESLLNTLDKEQKCADMIAPIMTAYANKADNQLAGVLSSLQISLSKINTEEVYYLTTKSDFSLDLNNPNSKGILVIGNTPTLASTYSPIIGLILTSISKQLNQQGKEKSVFMLDEFPTVYVPNIEQLPATARSNKVATILACQDIAQMVDKYGRDKSDTILSNLGNQFYGRTTNPQTAQRVSQLFGKADRLMATQSNNYDRTIIGDRRKGSGESFAYQERDLVKIQDVTTLQTGSFYSVLSEGEIKQGLSSIPLNKSFTKTEIEPFNNVSADEIEKAYYQVKEDIKEILISL
ncbi:type IV secretory system conjugative DNA transfer family protein [Flavobacterium degerlachei]|jgi:hypothetical protein|uniref:Type IV secretory system Conjugative DNA transfer n=1 Tax=Flavobacterium degerlachei TaxID=229203 RepID=A0A1H3GQ59_9FLAO|nr:type IV secretory system conjugative DNA transfer family protein [Flavobacterium degerlachei]SDY05452.1 Type IV secretory system Conjugative DNA transfer [Flavobacterium degerlachei]